jgi:quinol monooxygenase YgiN
VITFITRLRVRSENARALDALLAHVRDATRANEPDVVYYDFGRSADDAEAYVVIEVYRNAAAHAAHMETAWVKDSIPQTRRLIEGGFDIAQYVSPGTAAAVRRLQEG